MHLAHGNSVEILNFMVCNEKGVLVKRSSAPATDLALTCAKSLASSVLRTLPHYPNRISIHRLSRPGHAGC